MGLMKELNDLNGIYQKMYEGKKADKDYDGDGKVESGTAEYMGSKDKAIKKAMKKEAYTVTNADKKGNTPAYKAYKAGKKNVKTGKPMYKAADHLKDDVEISPEVEKLIESGKFSDAEIAKIADIQEADIADILARLEKKRISKGGNPDDSPLPAMKKYHAKKKKVKKGDWIGPPPKKTNEEVVLEKDLSAAERRALPDKEFALPGKGKGPEGKQAGSYPIPDEKHARSALSLVSQHGTPEEKAKVRAKVEKKFPGIKVSGK